MSVSNQSADVLSAIDAGQSPGFLLMVRRLLGWHGIKVDPHQVEAEADLICRRVLPLIREGLEIEIKGVGRYLLKDGNACFEKLPMDQRSLKGQIHAAITMVLSWHFYIKENEYAREADS